ncbi:uncharacterized protein AMSG_04844 [Thecamonas trahens ATCC 50062]|uniref:Uncharacterized protein n=1 Tax=Thecamonas trahens ATCC 50062 TaxID=461836 RepID=A0A0L0D7R0_THETB|nr:hypothetical protein AMSG_04844 [Thecamonas trahens ATCC 50062]KNC48394.1 hypothetical protein AMSG_04844 [Thecamonas trahens ATCC 50062]|eukprot:XP_013758512.1 hypothetical protein AMSG_04844 [Thecamonas trahens ATCC 50062]
MSVIMGSKTGWVAVSLEALNRHRVLVAAVASEVVLAPLLRLRVVLATEDMADAGGKNAVEKPPRSARELMRKMWEEDGWAGLWRTVPVRIVGTMVRHAVRQLAYPMWRARLATDQSKLAWVMLFSCTLATERLAVHPIFTIADVYAVESRVATYRRYGQAGETMAAEDEAAADGSGLAARLARRVPVLGVARKVHASGGLAALYAGVGGYLALDVVNAVVLAMIDSYSLRMAVSTLTSLALASPMFAVGSRLRLDSSRPLELQRYSQASLAPSLDVLADVLDHKGMVYLYRGAWLTVAVRSVRVLIVRGITAAVAAVSP